ncbi:MAG: hypothetical protein IT327_32050 [Anaerolineae bacterium]|nr:hypothetical protein [Anaerolineae bacterium]
MASSYSLFLLEQFPEIQVGNEISSVQQLSLDIPGVTEPPRTIFALQREISQLGIGVFRVTHEHIARKVGRVERINFTSFVAIEHFAGFLKRDLSLLMLKVNKDDAKRTMRNISRTHDDIVYAYANIDLDKLIGQLEGRLTGVYFTVDDSANISSGAYWGQRVDGDFRFDRALDEGAMTFIRFFHNFGGELFHVGASSDYNVVIYENNLDEHLELELVLDIKRRLLDGARIS